MPAADTSVPASLGNYDIVSKIAEGGMGTVYKARHRGTGEVVAVKVIAAGTAKNPVLLQRFEREFLAAKVLDHPNVVKAIEYCGTGPFPFLVMEFVDGESIGQWLERKGPIAEAEAIRLLSQVCEGLQRAHKQGLVHRDVKPDNILVTREGVAKLTDMGLVKDAEGDLNLTKTGRGLGTPHYMAPEQFRNAKNVDVRGDIYSLGATLYAMVTGVVPFENASPLECWMKKIKNEFPPPRELNPNLSERIDWAIRRAMSAEPDRRPASCREFVEDLTGQSRMPAGGPPSGRLAAEAADVWYMVYKDETGATHTGKASTEGIRRALREQRLGDPSTILVSRSKTGQFLSLASVPEFRDLVVNPAPLSPPSGGTRNSGSGILSKASGVIPQQGPRRSPDSDAVDLGTAPARGMSGSRSGRPPGPPSGRQPAPPASGKQATPPKPPPAPPPVIDPHADTVQYIPQTPPDTPLPPPRKAAARSGKAKPGPKPEPRKPFDWTPVFVILVMAISAVVGLLIFSK